MEPDRVTRVYLTNGGPPFAWLVFPEEQNYNDAFTGDKAEEIIKRCDFHCTNFKRYRNLLSGERQTIRDEWLVSTKPQGEDFVIDRSLWDLDERYSKLAAILEEKSGKTGLTIFCS